MQVRAPSAGEAREAFAYGTCGVVGRRADLQDLEPPAVEGDEIGEGAAGVGADEDQSADLPAAAFFFAGLDSDLVSDVDSDFVSVLVSVLPESPLASLEPPFLLPERP